MKPLALPIMIALLLAVAGCGGARRGGSSKETRPTVDDEKMPVEAYLFDAKLKRNGRPTSFRLELFQADTVIGLGGRGYLGKGALKGRLTADSLYVYFPSTREFVYEDVNDLMGSFDCAGNVPEIDLLDLFSNRPDSYVDDIEASVIGDFSNEKRPKYQIRFHQCPWQIDLVYDLQDSGWRIRRFTFSDGGDVSLKATRREYRDRAKVRRSKFEDVADSLAVRIIP